MKLLKVVILTSCILIKIVLLLPLDMEMEWNNFKIKYGKYYDSELAETKHYQNFLESWNLIQNHNVKYYQGIVTYKLSINRMADYNRAERLKYFYGFNMTKDIESRSKNKPPTFLKPENVIRSSVNWVEDGAVTEVKDQEYCGSCWAFASTGALEGQHYRLTKKLILLSEQNLLDCSWDYGNNGCSGGLMTYSYEYIRDNKGIDTESAYPYDGEDWWCRFKPNDVGATDKGYIEISSSSEQQLMQAVATVGPISAAITADSPEFQFYKEGIFVGQPCEKFDYLDHAVLVVGYDTDNKTGQDYWLVKNSWGIDWGDRGYIRMARNKENANCIAKLASYPLM